MTCSVVVENIKLKEWFNMTKSVIHLRLPFSLRQGESCREKTLYLYLTRLLSSLKRSCLAALKDTLGVYTTCPFGSHSGLSYGHSLSFPICSVSLHL